MVMPNTSQSVVTNGKEEKEIRILLKDIIVDESLNCRKNYEDIEELADSIDGINLEESLKVRLTKKGYLLNAGFRRMRAIQLLSKIPFAEWRKTKSEEKPSKFTIQLLTVGIPCKVMEYESDALAKIANLSENTSKRGLKTFDLAITFHELEEIHGMKRKKIAEFCGVTLGYISQLVSLYKGLAPEVLDAWSSTDKVAQEIPVSKLLEWKKEEPEAQVKLLEDYQGGNEGIEDPDVPEEEKDNSKKGGKLPSKSEMKTQWDKLEAKKANEDGISDIEVGMIKCLKWCLGKTKTLK